MTRIYLNSKEAAQTNHPNFIATSSKQKTHQGHLYTKIGIDNLKHGTGWQVGRVFMAIGMSALSVFLFPWAIKSYRKQVVTLWKECTSGATKLSLYVLRYSKDQLAALASVKKDPNNYQHLTEAMRDDEEVLLEALKHKSGHPIQYASERLKKMQNIALTVVRNDATDYQYLSKEMQADEDVLEEALKGSGYPILHAPSELKETVKYVLSAVRKSPEIYKDLSQTMRDNDEILEEALKGSAEPFKHANETQKNTMKFAKAAVGRSPDVYKDLPQVMRDKDEILEEALKGSAEPFKHANDLQKSNEKLVLLALSKNGTLYKDLPKEMQENKKVVLATFQEISANLEISLSNKRVHGLTPLVYISEKELEEIFSKVPANLQNDSEVKSAYEKCNEGFKELALDQVTFPLKYLTLHKASQENKKVILATLKNISEILQISLSNKRVHGLTPLPNISEKELKEIFGKVPADLQNDFEVKSAYRKCKAGFKELRNELEKPQQVHHTYVYQQPAPVYTYQPPVYTVPTPLYIPVPSFHKGPIFHPGMSAVSGRRFQGPPARPVFVGR